MEEENTTTDAFHVGHLSLKLPPFMEDDPEAWFGLVEAQFELRSVTGDSKKFYHTVSVLQGEPQKQIKDILKLPRTTPDKYDQLKARLLDTYGMNDLDRSAQVMAWPPMAEDERPSVYINGLLSKMADIPTNHPFFRATVLSKLPGDLTELLRATSACDDIKTMIKDADRIWQGGYNKRKSANAINALRMQQNSNKGYKSKTYSRLADMPNSNGLCPWHQRFGNQARFCRDPCNFSIQPEKNGMKQDKNRI